MPKNNRLAEARQLELGIRVYAPRAHWTSAPPVEVPQKLSSREPRLAKGRRTNSRAFARERIVAFGVVVAIIFGALGLIVVAEYLHLDVGPIREVFAIGLASLLPVFDRIASYYFGARRR